MMFNCQRKQHPNEGLYPVYYVHTIEASDEATARVKMFNRSMDRTWLDLERTAVWSNEEWIAT